ncbi:MAG: LacI family transcriptional regulator [Gammaproteobacteria bacterium]|nr:LacI family transcriptional regulator [Gammaproteobacteria bacterium]
MVTIKDVARVAKVSPSTVSRVVRGQGKVGKKCRAKVQKVIDELGYIPNLSARALVNRRTELIGVVTPDLFMPFFGSIAHGAEIAAREAGYQIMMRNSQDDPKLEAEAVNSLREHGCQNIILHSKWADAETLKTYAKQIPGFVLINRFEPDLATRSVWLDNVAGGRMIAEHLYKKGHRDIAVIGSPVDNQDLQDRISGIRQGLQAKGLNLPDENIIYHNPEQDNGEEHAINAVAKLFQRSVKYTAIVTYNDVMAIRVLNALYDSGKQVPADVSVMGFDNLNLASICRPGLTTVEYPIIEMAKYATKLSLELTNEDNDEIQRTHLFMPKIVERKSVGSINQT